MKVHFLSGERLLLLRHRCCGKTDTGRIWVYVRDDKPFGGPAPPAAVFHYWRDRAGRPSLGALAGYNGDFRPTPTAVVFYQVGSMLEVRGGSAPGGRSS